MPIPMPIRLAALRNYLSLAFRWQRGRQGTGYDKMLLATARWPLPFDSYLIRYPEGSEIPPHTDPVQAGRHYRLNIVLKSPRGRRVRLRRADLRNAAHQALSPRRLRTQRDARGGRQPLCVLAGLGARRQGAAPSSGLTATQAVLKAR